MLQEKGRSWVPLQGYSAVFRCLPIAGAMSSLRQIPLASTSAPFRSRGSQAGPNPGFAFQRGATTRQDRTRSRPPSRSCVEFACWVRGSAVEGANRSRPRSYLRPIVEVSKLANAYRAAVGALRAAARCFDFGLRELVKISASIRPQRPPVFLSAGDGSGSRWVRSLPSARSARIPGEVRRDPSPLRHQALDARDRPAG
jgi:hypothetical protein